jgi:hypothetical protein
VLEKKISDENKPFSPEVLVFLRLPRGELFSFG